MKDQLIEKFLDNKFILRSSKVLEFKFELLNKIMNYSNLSFNRYIKKHVLNKFKFVRKLSIIRRHVYGYKINKFKLLIIFI